MRADPTLLTRRGALAALAAAVGLAAAGRDRPARAETRPPEDFGLRRAQAATAPGAPSLPDIVTVARADGSTYTVPFDDYVKGVVAGEMPSSWPSAALHAQAIAARTYTAAWIATYGAIAETNQAYAPASRSAATDAAVDATRGQILTYRGGTIYAYYASTCGGETTTIPDAAAAYCQSVRCWREADGSGRAPLDLSSEAAASAYWGATPAQPAFCSSAPLYRWSPPAATRAAKERILDSALSRPGASPSPAYTKGQIIGQLKDLVVLSRASSGKIAGLKIVAVSNATWTITGETDLRWAVSSTEEQIGWSASAVLSIARDGAGLPTTIAARGGGYGHGWGMCQYGARGMAERGYDAATILRHYYTGVALVTIAGQPVPPARGPRLYLPLGPKRGGLPG
ncbi:MAG TPA: SpoIID/LytB domain-containing protein [Chloroflexota bacterium]